jgi:transposase InsO family protein
VLADNGATFTATPRRGGRTALQIMLGELGINDISSRPYHPQPCGKVERFHQTSKTPRHHQIGRGPTRGTSQDPEGISRKTADEPGTGSRDYATT